MAVFFCSAQYPDGFLHTEQLCSAERLWSELVPEQPVRVRASVCRQKESVRAHNSVR